MGTHNYENSAIPLPLSGCFAYKIGCIWENRNRWHLGVREEKSVGFEMSIGHAGDRESEDSKM